jgi:uncharacterized membrane protein
MAPLLEDLVNSAKLYVGNLSYETSEASIGTAFEAHGEAASAKEQAPREPRSGGGYGGGGANRW